MKNNPLRRGTITLLVVLFLLVPLVAGGTSSLGDSALTRLWAEDRQGNRVFACTGFYIVPKIAPYGAWLASTGHCTRASLVGRDNSVSVFGSIDWRVVVVTKYTGRYVDLALGSLPDPRPDGQQHFLFLADKAPSPGTTVYVHGFPLGVEAVTFGVMGDPAEHTPGSREVRVPWGAVQPGSSGSPVLSQDGRVVGIVWGYRDASNPETGEDEMLRNKDGTMTVLITPVEALHEAIALMGGLRHEPAP